jgi:hypothetical protein
MIAWIEVSGCVATGEGIGRGKDAVERMDGWATRMQVLLLYCMSIEICFDPH